MRDRLLQRAGRLRQELRRLTQRRSAELANGTLELLPGSAPDRLTLKILRDQLEAQGLPDGPFSGAARVYSTTLRKTGSVGGTRGLESGPNEPVYVVVVRFAYRDYTGGKHLDSTTLAATVEARTLETTDVAWGAAWHLPRLGRAIDLRL